MHIKNVGYIFDCRYDCYKNVGVIDSFDIMFKMGIQNVKLVTAVDAYGKIIKPVYSDTCDGFSSLDKLISKETFDKDLERFIKSHKMFFSKLGDFAMIVVADLKFDQTTGAFLEEKSLINFYVPKYVDDNIPEVVSHGAKQEPAVVCDRVSDTDGVNTMVIKSSLYQNYRSSFLADLTANCTVDKKNYLSFRLKGN